MPAQCAGTAVERYQRAGVKIVAGAVIAIPIRSRISDAPVDQVQLRIVRSRYPRRSAAGFPGIARPAFVTRLTRSRDGIETPSAFSGLGVVSIDEATNAGLAPTDTYHPFAGN